MPDVPNVDGVPPLLSYSASSIVLAVVDLVSLLLGFGPVWGVFDEDGNPVFESANSTASFEFSQDWTIANYPIEQGGFQSYDKVQNPFNIRMRITSGAAEFERQELLQDVQDAANALDLYTVVTPEQIFQNCNITHFDYVRTADHGVGMIVIDIWFVQIRLTATANFQNTMSPANAGQNNIGNQTPMPVTTPVGPTQ
jgi:hypothetical protein